MRYTIKPYTPNLPSIYHGCTENLTPQTYRSTILTQGLGFRGIPTWLDLSPVVKKGHSTPADRQSAGFKRVIPSREHTGNPFSHFFTYFRPIPRLGPEIPRRKPERQCPNRESSFGRVSFHLKSYPEFPTLNPESEAGKPNSSSSEAWGNRLKERFVCQCCGSWALAI